MRTGAEDTVPDLAAQMKNWREAALVYDQRLGGQRTFVVKIGDDYYLVERARPAFERIDPTAELSTTGASQSKLEILSDKLWELKGRQTKAARCEVMLIEMLIDRRRVIFGSFRDKWLKWMSLLDVEPTNYEYFLALKTITEAWKAQANFLTAE